METKQAVKEICTVHNSCNVAKAFTCHSELHVGYNSEQILFDFAGPLSNAHVRFCTLWIALVFVLDAGPFRAELSLPVLDSH
jgi:hypothetical protein